MKFGLDNPVLAAGDYGQLVGIIVVLLLSLLGSLAERAKKKAEQRERERQAQMRAQEAHNAPSAQSTHTPTVPPVAPRPARPPIRTQMPGRGDRSVEEIVAAMRRATREQAQKSQPQLSNQARPQVDQSRHDTQEHAQRQAERNVQHQAQRTPKVRPQADQSRHDAQEHAQRQAERNVQRQVHRAPQAARPTSAKPALATQVPPVPQPEAPSAPLGSVSDRSLTLEATGREVDEEIAHLRARLAMAERVREERLTQRGGLLQHGAEHGPTVAEMLRADLVEASELRRAIIYSEILAKPLAIRQEAPAWDSF